MRTGRDETVQRERFRPGPFLGLPFLKVISNRDSQLHGKSWIWKVQVVHFGVFFPIAIHAQPKAPKGDLGSLFVFGGHPVMGSFPSGFP